MSKRCELSGKSPLKGHRVSHANNKEKRKFLPNLKKITFKSEILKRNIKLNVSNSALKTVDYKGGLDNFLKTVKKYKLSKRVKFLNKSINNIFSKKFDLIVSNPPYVDSKDIKNLSDDIKKFEPRIALDGGNDGLDLIKKVIYKSKDILKINGMLALEIGNEQIKKVSKILIDNNFRIKHVIKDYKTNVRCVFAYYK